MKKPGVWTSLDMNRWPWIGGDSEGRDILVIPWPIASDFTATDDRPIFKTLEIAFPFCLHKDKS